MSAQVQNGYASAPALYDEVAASRGELDEALRQIDALRHQESLLHQEVARLVGEVERAHRLAHHDELTGLPSRRLLVDRFKQAVAAGARQQKQVALLFLDLDRFKRINDVFGHAVGDDLLRQVAVRLTDCIRASDTACRYGGDEFVVLLPEFEGRECMMAVAKKIRAHLARPYLIHGAAITMTTSMGIAVHPFDGTDYRDLIEMSDLAMYRDKSRHPPLGRERFPGDV